MSALEISGQREPPRLPAAALTATALAAGSRLLLTEIPSLDEPIDLVVFHAALRSHVRHNYLGDYVALPAGLGLGGAVVGMGGDGGGGGGDGSVDGATSAQVEAAFERFCLNAPAELKVRKAGG